MTHERIIAAEAYCVLVDSSIGNISQDDLEDLRQEGRVAIIVKQQHAGPIDDALCRKIVHDKMIDWVRRELRHDHEPLPAEI